MADDVKYGVVLNAVREELEISADEFAAAFKISTAELAAYENGISPIPGVMMFQIMWWGVMLIVNGKMFCEYIKNQN